MNMAIESDDTHPMLRRRARKAMDRVHDAVRNIVAKGIERGEVRDTVDPDKIATLMIATLEGALMLSKLYNDEVHMMRAAEHLSEHIRTQVQA